MRGAKPLPEQPQQPRSNWHRIVRIVREGMPAKKERKHEVVLVAGRTAAPIGVMVRRHGVAVAGHAVSEVASMRLQLASIQAKLAE